MPKRQRPDPPASPPPSPAPQAYALRIALDMMDGGFRFEWMSLSSRKTVDSARLTVFQAPESFKVRGLTLRGKGHRGEWSDDCMEKPISTKAFVKRLRDRHTVLDDD